MLPIILYLGRDDFFLPYCNICHYYILKNLAILFKKQFAINFIFYLYSNRYLAWAIRQWRQHTNGTGFGLSF